MKDRPQKAKRLIEGHLKRRAEFLAFLGTFCTPFFYRFFKKKNKNSGFLLVCPNNRIGFKKDWTGVKSLPRQSL